MKKLLLILFSLSIILYAQNNCETKLFSLKSEYGIKIKEYIDNLADECGLTVIVKDKYANLKLNERLGKITLDKVSLDELLNVILSAKNLYYELQGNILKIGYLQTKTFKVDYVISKRSGESTTNASVDIGNISPEIKQTTPKSKDVNMITSKEEFDFWENLGKEIFNILNRPEDSYKAPQPIINPKAGLVTVTGTKEQIQRVQNYLNTIEERLHKEVLIDVSILAVVLNDEFSKGIDWNRFNILVNGTLDAQNNFIPGDPIFQWKGVGQSSIFHNSATTIINTAFNLSGLINFLKQSGKVITLSNPKILTLNNQPAIITIGDTFNYNVPTSITITANNNGLGEKSYTPASTFVGILLNITPEITRDNNIILRINPSISELRNPEQVNQKTESGFREIAPDTREKKISTVVKVKDGSTLILGGLISNTRNFTLNGVPILKDIPLFGNLFGNKRKQYQRFELIFVIRPKIVSTNSFDNFGLKDLGYKDLKSYE